MCAIFSDCWRIYRVCGGGLRGCSKVDGVVNLRIMKDILAGRTKTASLDGDISRRTGIKFKIYAPRGWMILKYEFFEAETHD